MSGWRVNWVDYYAILELDRGANPDTIKKKYRKMVAKYHPDIYDGEDAHEKTAQINEAYEVLSNQEEKKAYDSVWDARKNGTYTEGQGNDGNNVNSNVSYDDIKNNYTAEEKRYAKQLALKEIIKEELQKVEIIINSKNEVIFSAYKGNVDKREYYATVKELVNIGFNYINDLNNLSQEAYKYDLLEEEELIGQTIEYLEQELKDIPLTPKDASVHAKEEEFKETTKLKISEELISCGNVIEKLRSILIYSYEKQISHLEYKGILQNVIFEAKEVISKLKELSQIAATLKLEEECKQVLEATSRLNGMLINMPNDYDEAVKAGQRETLKEKIKECTNAWSNYKNKIDKISRILSKYPNSKRWKGLYKHAESLFEDYSNELSALNKEISLVTNEKNVNEERVKELSYNAVKVYEDAESLHKQADEVYEKLDVDNLDNNDIYYLNKSAYAAWDKGKALEIFLEAKEALDAVSYVTGSDTEFDELCNLTCDMMGAISLAKKEFERSNDITRIDPYANYNLLDYKIKLHKLEDEFNHMIGFGAISGVIGLTTGSSAAIMIPTDKKSAFIIGVMIAFGALSFFSTVFSIDSFKCAKKLRKEKKYVKERMQQYIDNGFKNII